MSKSSSVLRNPYLLEVGCGDVDSALAAWAAGADRIELFANMPEGGTTPSVGTLSSVLSKVSIPVMVMIRPRGGDFIFSDDEFRAMCYDVETVRNLGASGIVIGCLTPDASIDVEKCKKLVELAVDLDITFHRAFDLTFDLFASLDILIGLGINRVLTTGGKITAMEGREIIQKLRMHAGSEITIMPGGGVRANNLRTLVTETGCAEFHMAPVKKRNSAFKNSNCPESFFTTSITDPDEIIQAIQILKAL